jgi:hypothetical protein
MAVHMVVLRVVVLQALVFQHMVRKENYLHILKKKKDSWIKAK